MKRNVTFLIVLLLMAAGVMKGQITESSTASNFTPYNSSSQTSTFQFPNSGFEHWDTHSNSKASAKAKPVFITYTVNATGDYQIVPTLWHTFDEASAGLTGTAASGNEVSKLNHHHKTSGSNVNHGNAAIGIICTKVSISVISTSANGAISTGQTVIGSSSASDAANYNYGHTGASGYTNLGNGTFNYPFTGCPDSLSFWYKTSWTGSAKPIFKVYTYSSSTFKDKANSTTEGTIVGSAAKSFNSSNSWKRAAWAFTYSGTANTDDNYSTISRPVSMLASFSTNENAGSGNENDELFIDDLYCIYDKGLASLSIGGVSQNAMLAYFNSREWLTHQNNPNSGVAEYNYGTTVLASAIPTVVATAKSQLISGISISQATADNPHATITVTHNDGSTFVYTIHFEIESPCETTYGVDEKTACGSFAWYGTTYTQSTNTPTYTLQNAAGCDSVVTLHLTINNPQHTAVTVEKCGSYTWTDGNGQTYTQSGDYTYSHADAHGCTQVDTLHLTINNPQHTAVTVEKCGSYTWTDGNGQTYTQSGDYTYSHTDANGCTQVDTLHLTINNPTHTAVTESACGSYTWNGTTYTESGNYTYSHTDANGCTQVDTLHLTIHNPVHTAVTESACGSYTWNGTIYTESGNYTYSHTDANGCTQVDTLHLTINNPQHTGITESACGSYTWNGTTYNQSGNYTYSHTDANGCTQVDTLHLTIHNPTHTAVTESACGSYTWNGTTYNESGNYTYSHTDANGCTQVDTLHLTINIPQHTAVTKSACGSYTWNGTTYTESGNFTFEHNDNNGCTQVDTLHLTINNPQHTGITVTAYDSYTWNGTAYTQSGDFTFAHNDNNGCEQVDTLHLTVYYSSSNEFSATACGSYTWNNSIYETSGDYTQQFHDIHGADSTVTLHLTINPVYEQEVETTACVQYTWNNVIYTESGDYTQELTSSKGCDSIVTLHLTIHNPVHQASHVTAYNSYLWSEDGSEDVIPGDGETYTQSGTYYFTHNDNNGCEQVDTLHLTVYYSSANEFSATACGSYTWNNTIYETSGDYTQQFHDIHGADSTVTLHLTINPVYEQEVEATACVQYTWNNVIYTESGDYTQNLTSSKGCDSIVTLHLTIHNPVHKASHVTAYNSYLWSEDGSEDVIPGDGVTYTQSGDFTFAHNDNNGCIQVDTLHLTVYYSSANEFSATACGSYTWNNTIYETSGDYTQLFHDIHGADSTVTLHLTINPVYEQEVEATACVQYTWNNEIYTESGNYIQNLTSSKGCDSIVTLHLTIHNPVHQASHITAYDSYLWSEDGSEDVIPGDGETYTQSGDFTYEHLDNHGCTQVDTLHLTIYYSSANEFSATACGSYTWNNTIYETSGDYTQQFHDIHGADSTVTLHLTINPVYEQEVEATACVQYTWNNEIYTESGDYTQNLTSSKGCDSIVTLHLTIHNPVHQASHVTAYNSYLWSEDGSEDVIPGDGVTYTQSGDYTFAHNDNNGCIQVDTLHLTVFYSSNNEFSATACGSYTWNNSIYETSGDYTQLFHDIHGADSTVTLHLTINPVYEQEVEATACVQYTWNNVTYNESGNYIQNLTSSKGCDSIVTLHLTIHNPQHTGFTESACGSYTWNNTIYTQSGDYTYEHLDNHGCTQVDTLHLTIHNPQHLSFTESACGSYTWNNTTYTQSGDYTFAHNDNFGCTQVDTLHLTIRKHKHQTIEETVCESQLPYYLNGDANYAYNAGGTYEVSLNTVEGCDSTISLTLHVVSAFEKNLNATVCNEELPYIFNGQSFNEAGNYDVTVTSNDGCDTIVHLHLEVTDNCSVVCETSVLHDGYEYPIVKIGNNCWFAENLRVTTGVSGATPYRDDPANTDKFGLLYTWYAATAQPEPQQPLHSAMPAPAADPMTKVASQAKGGSLAKGPSDITGICPTGWKIPTVEDFQNMIAAAGYDVDAIKDPDVTTWLPGHAGIDPGTGFDAPAAGYFDSLKARYACIKDRTYFWTITSGSTEYTAMAAEISYYCPELMFTEIPKLSKLSIRCIKIKD